MGNRLARWAIACLVGMLITGCGGAPDRPPVYKVNGVLKLAGKPVPDATVQFKPEKGRPAKGKTNASGEFSLTTYNTNDGAIEGRHQVTVVAAISEQIVSNTPDDLKKIEAAAAVVPAKYADAKTSGLVNTVEKDGKNFFEIDLN
mgnify:CR=1 FL=1